MTLQRLQQIIDVFRASQDGGNDDHAATLWRYSARRIAETRQQLRFEQQSGEPVPQGHRQLTDPERKCDPAQTQPPPGNSTRLRRVHESQRGQKREQKNSAYVESEGKLANASFDKTFPPPARTGRALQSGKTFVD